MEFEAPDWLNKEFIRDALQDGKNAPDNLSVIVESIEIDKPIAKGDNYVSDVFRATVKYRRQVEKDKELNTSLIIKAPKVGGLAEFISECGILKKEVNMYNEYIPRMNKIFGPEKILAPNSLYSGRENVLVLEDLKFKGYVMADRRAQLDFEHASIALRTLALFHAASVKLHKDDPQLVERVGKELFFEESLPELNHTFAKLNFTVMANAARGHPNLYRYAEQLLGYGENSWNILVEMVKPNDDCLNVLNHGDYWVNNMLFKYDENKKPIDLKVLDLQISRYARPALDILYFFYGSVREEVRLKRLDELLKIYLDELNTNLERFGVTQRLTESELKATMDDCEFFALFISISLYPVITGDPKNGVLEMSEMTMDEITNSENNFEKNPLNKYYKDENVLKVIGDRFLEFEKKGWF